MANSQTHKTIRNIIADLGGVSAVSRLIDKTPGAVSQWYENVPHKHYAALLSEAKRLHLPIRLEHLAGLLHYERQRK